MSTPVSPARAPSPHRNNPPLWRNLSFTLMWTSTAASGFGDRMIMLGAWALLGGMIHGSTDSTSVQASTQFFFFLPYIFISIPGGWLADHLPRKWLLLSCDEARGLILLLAFFAVAQAGGPADIPQDHHWKVYLALAAIGCFAAVFNPTRNAIIPQIIPTPQLPSGNAVILVINVVASMVGMIVGGWIIQADQAVSVRHGLLMGALFYLVSGTFFAFLRPTSERNNASRTEPRSFWQAARYVTRHRRIVALVALGVLVWSSAAAVSSGIPGVVKGHYGLQSDELKTAFTTLSAAMGVGLLGGAVLVMAVRTRRESPVLTLAALAMVGVCVLLFVTVRWMPATYAAAFCIGLFGNVVIINVLTLLQSVTPNYMRGRVMGINSMVNTMFSVLTYFAIWRLPAADTNIIYALYALGGLLIGVGCVGLLRYLTRGPMPNRTANAVWRLDRLFCLVWHRLEIVGRHHVPSAGPVILAANHTTALDPFIMQAGSLRLVHWVMLTRYRFRFAEPVWRAVEPIALERNGGDIANIRRVVETLKRGEAVGLFPEGGLQRTRRELGPMEPGIGMIAKRSGATIVPVWIHGTPLRDSMILHILQPSRSVVVFGEPYTPDPKDDPKRITEDLRGRLLAISKRFQSKPSP
jgi:1-acyl-sn-glycerol-3-phosphate acyltransferase